MGGALSLNAVQLLLRDGRRQFRLICDRLDLSAGHAVALTGESGSGKTLLLELLGMLRKPDAGRYVWHDGDQEVDLAGLWLDGPRSSALARKRGQLFGFVPQTGGLLPFLTVTENVSLPQRVIGRPDAGRVDMLLDRLGLTDVATQFPLTLSIGQRQRCAVARALSHSPPFVIADEPTAALDPEAADRVLTLLLECAGEQGSGVVLSSHDLDRVARFGIKQVSLRVVPGEEVVSRLEVATCL
ncbi:ABC transporter ATP-binding protein [Primorskyibacter sp. S87]|uniref:ABC transporter ATP-binding protein n=1 Tax=Primorskyibacter sp. S87 TaxID=3415126 RepID=UPI003C7A130F